MSSRQVERLVLALDIGTSSARSAFFTDEGERLEDTTAQQAYALQYSADGGAELSPAVLRDAVVNCIESSLEKRRKERQLRGSSIIAVGTSCFWHSLIGVGKANIPATPIYTWADSRCRADAARLRKEFSEKAIHRKTGCMLRASFWPAKLAWIRRTQPRRKILLWMSPAEWIQREFLGSVHCSFSMASGTGLFRSDKPVWDQAFLDRFGLKANNLNPTGDEPVIGCRRFKELELVPWFPAIGDGAASNLGSGATTPGVAAINVGTSAAVRIVKSGSGVRSPFGLFCYRVDERRFLVGGAISNAGNLRQWCLRELNLCDKPGSLEAEMALRPTPNHGLTIIPSWMAERAPSWSEEETGVIEGITQSTTALDILQATTEAGYYRIATIVGMLTESEKQKLKFIVSGGIVHSPSSLQRLADILNQPLAVNEDMESSLRGAAVFALEKMGMKPAPAKLKPRSVRPRKKFADIYRTAMDAQRKLEVRF